ncbi:MAG: HEAT repeat domain-containing protein [Bryobacterales bacterium]|nr:HEAT repeat domain-containing protein [Bryobacterales bacterium]
MSEQKTVDIDDLAFYLLEVAVEFPIPLRYFSANPGRLGGWLNHSVPRHSRSELIASLLELQAAGYIRFLWDGKSAEAVNAAEVEAGIVNGVPLSYELTPHGGDRWAAICGVNWRYWKAYDGYPGFDTTKHVLTTGDMEYTEFWLEVDRRFQVVVPGSVQWEEVRPWFPVEWHEEPAGWRVTYVTQDNETPETSVARSRWAPYRPTPRPTSPLAPRAVRPVPVVDRPLQHLGDEELDWWGAGDPRREFAKEMERVARSDDLATLRLWLRCDGARYAAARRLGTLRDKVAVPALLRAVFSEGDIAAVEALGEIGDERCLSPLTTLFEYLEERKHGPLLDTIGRTIAGFGEAGATALLPFADRESGCQALVYSKSERVVAELQRQAADGGWQAWEALVEMGLLSRRRRKPPSKLTPERAAQLTAWAARPDWKSRFELVVHLLNTPSMLPEDAADLLAKLREDPDPVVRGCARFGLRC